MKKAIVLLLITAMSFTLFSCSIFEDVQTQKTEDKKYTFLVSGIDDAAENTDVIFLLNIDLGKSAVSVVQIPRDTFMAHSFLQNKINQYYASMRADGMSEYDAMKSFAELLSANLGINIDGFMGITLSAFRDIVNSLGGIRIYLPKDIVIYTEDGDVTYKLNKGENILNGDIAEHFVRFRKSYIMGDLGRLDAQKLFLSAIFNSIVKESTPSDMIGMIGSVKDKLTTNIEMDTVISLFSIFLDRKSITQRFITMPGEACENDTGLSYYCLNKKGTEEVIAKYLTKHSPFDSKGIFVNKGIIKFENIYYDPNMQYPEYTEESIKEMHILGR